MKILKRGDKHIPKTIEVGLFECKHCGSELELLRADFVRPRLAGAAGTAACLVCQSTISENLVAWTERPVTR